MGCEEADYLAQHIPELAAWLGTTTEVCLMFRTVVNVEEVIFVTGTDVEPPDTCMELCTQRQLLSFNEVAAAQRRCVMSAGNRKVPGIAGARRVS